MNATVVTLVLLTGATPSGGPYYAGYPTAEPAAAATEAYVPPVWYESIFCCGGNMPQTCYEPRFGCYSGQSRFTHRYPAFHGTHYRRPYNYRQYFDYPWHAALHEPTSMFAYTTEEAVPGRPTSAAATARRGASPNAAYASTNSPSQPQAADTEQAAPAQGIPSMVVPTVDPGYLRYLISEVARGVAESEDQHQEAAQVVAEQPDTETAATPEPVNQVTHLDPKSLAAAVNAVTQAQLSVDSAAENVAAVEPAYEQPLDPVVVKATPLERKLPATEWRRRDTGDKK